MTITYEAQVDTAVTLLMRMLPEILNGMTIEAAAMSLLRREEELYLMLANKDERMKPVRRELLNITYQKLCKK